MRAPRREVKRGACAAATAALAGLFGCGADGDRRAAGTATGSYEVAVQRAAFAARQRIGQRTTFVLAVRNGGERTIPELAVTLRGFGAGTRDRDVAGAGRDPWLVDAPPAGAATAIDDTWSAGALRPGATATLRWSVTAVLAGAHRLSYAIAPALAGSARARLAGDRPARGSVTVRVTGEPARARVDPRSGRVIRIE